MKLNTIYCEDCIETMRRMPDGFVDLVVTSPPYDGLRTYNGFSFDFEAVANGLHRVVKQGGVVVWVVADQTKNGSESGTSFRQALRFMEIGFNLHDTMIYRKTRYVPLTHNRYEQEFEYMFVLSKGRPNTFNPIMEGCKHAGVTMNARTFYQSSDQNVPTASHGTGTVKSEKIIGNVWDITPGGAVKGHPAQFPEQLAEDHIRSWSNEGDIVYDPFMGSGTTAVCAARLGRQFVGSELSEDYVSIANHRLLC